MHVYKIRKTRGHNIPTCLPHNTRTVPQASPNIKSYKYANTNFHT